MMVKLRLALLVSALGVGVLLALPGGEAMAAAAPLSETEVWLSDGQEGEEEDGGEKELGEDVKKNLDKLDAITGDFLRVVLYIGVGIGALFMAVGAVMMITAANSTQQHENGVKAVLGAVKGLAVLGVARLLAEVVRDVAFVS